MAHPVLKGNTFIYQMLYLNHAPHPHSVETRRALQAADGYLFLNLPEEALAEIQAVRDPEGKEPEVLLAQNRVLLHLGRWKEAERLARRAAESHPDREEFTVQRAFALQQMQKAKEALGVLESAPDWIRRTGILHYNLACYEAQLGNKKAAQECINLAFQMNEAMRKNAKVDPDLQGLWN
jgi:tetratricopeptide (TPR) repeat protein